jgi:hypothetical protein
MKDRPGEVTSCAWSAKKYRAKPGGAAVPKKKIHKKKACESVQYHSLMWKKAVNAFETLRDLHLSSPYLTSAHSSTPPPARTVDETRALIQRLFTSPTTLPHLAHSL